MTNKFIVVKGRPSSFKYLTHFVGVRPYSSSDIGLAMVFEDESRAKFAARRCNAYTGRTWKVIELGESSPEDIKKASEVLSQIFMYGADAVLCQEVKEGGNDA